MQALGLTRGEQLQVANLKPSAPVEVHLVSLCCIRQKSILLMIAPSLSSIPVPAFCILQMLSL